MNRDELIKIINEEISEYDFLGNDKYAEEQENIDLIKNEDFQKQFILDSILKKDKIKENVTESNITNDWEDENKDTMGIEYFTEITYKYDPNKEPIRFVLNLYGTNVSFNTDGYNDLGTYDTAPYGEQWYTNIDWSDISVDLATMGGDVIPFIAFEKANPKMQRIFVREYIESMITDKSLDIKEPKETM